MICVSLMNRSAEWVLHALTSTPDLEMAEIRLDGIDLKDGDIARLFGTKIITVATHRPTADLDDEVRGSRLINAIDAGASWVDLEIESSPEFQARVIARAREKGCRVIVSYHNYIETPSADVLNRIVEQCFAIGADLAKVACAVSQPLEAARLLGLIDSKQPVLAIGMGDKGRITRIAAPLAGAPFTFAALDDASCTAPGQYALARLKKIYTDIGTL